MPRRAGVWWNSGKKAWYTTLDGNRKVRVADGDKSEKEAEMLWHQLHAKQVAPDLRELNPVRVIAELYLDWFEEAHPPSYEMHRWHLKRFCDAHGDVKVRDLTADIVNGFLRAQTTWGPSTRTACIKVISASLNWAASADRRLIPYNPIRGMKQPGIRSRAATACARACDHQRVIEAASPNLRVFLEALRASGTRPINLCRMTADHVRFDLGAVLLPKHKTDDGTEAPLVIPITPEFEAVLRTQVAAYPKGPLFPTRTGKAWLPRTVSNMVRRIRVKLKAAGEPLEGQLIPYGYRHAMATELLEGGMADHDVAAFMGNRPATLHRNYNHIVRNPRRIAQEATAALNRDAGKG